MENTEDRIRDRECGVRRSELELQKKRRQNGTFKEMMADVFQNQSKINQDSGAPTYPK